MPPWNDNFLVSRFIDNAVEILDAAENVLKAGETPSQYSILMGSGCGIHLVANSDWPLDSLRREYGADMAYRVQTTSDRVSVDGRDGSRTCHFESESPARIARMLLNATPVCYTYAQHALAA